MSELPIIPTSQIELSYPFPNVVIAASASNGRRQYTLLEGGDFPVIFDIEDYYSFEEEFREPFKVLAFNHFNIAGVTISALNDANPDLGLLPSNPTASEYLALRSTSVLRSFLIRKDPSMTEQFGKPVFRIYKAWMKL